MSHPFDALLDELAERLADRLEARQKQGAAGMVGQETSPLGRRRHCAAVRRRISANLPGAAIVGRRCLLSPEALSEELNRASGAKRTRSVESEASTTQSPARAELDRQLRLIRAAR